MDTKELTKVQKDREEKLKKLRSEGFNFPNDFACILSFLALLTFIFP